MAKKENTTSIGFEEIIWRAADKLRGNLSASEYEGVVLGLIFLKYISDKFEEKYNELEDDEYADVPEFDADFDIAISKMEEPNDEKPSVSEDVDGYKVVRVSYNKNVKTGQTSNKGEVIVIIPSVDANGDVHDDMRKITFSLDSDHRPIVNNEYMPLAMYNAIVNAIEMSPETDNVDTDITPEDTTAENDTTELTQDNIENIVNAVDNGTDVANVESTSI